MSGMKDYGEENAMLFNDLDPIREEDPDEVYDLDRQAKVDDRTYARFRYVRALRQVAYCLEDEGISVYPEIVLEAAERLQDLESKEYAKELTDDLLDTIRSIGGDL